MTREDRMRKEAAKLMDVPEHSISDTTLRFYENWRFMRLYSSGPKKLGEVFPFGGGPQSRGRSIYYG